MATEHHNTLWSVAWRVKGRYRGSICEVRSVAKLCGRGDSKVRDMHLHLRSSCSTSTVRTMSTSSYSGVHTAVFHNTIPRLSLHVQYLRMLQNSYSPRERPLPFSAHTATYHQARSRQPYSTFTYDLVQMPYGVQHLDRRTAVVGHEGPSGEDPFSPELRNKKEAELYIRRA